MLHRRVVYTNLIGNIASDCIIWIIKIQKSLSRGRGTPLSFPGMVTIFICMQWTPFINFWDSSLNFEWPYLIQLILGLAEFFVYESKLR